MTFTLRVEHRDDTAVVVLAGELDMATAPEVGACIDELIAAGVTRVVFDLGELTFCDSAGLNAFIRGDKHCAARGGWVRLTRPRGHVARVMEISGVLDMLEYRPAPDAQPGT